MAPQPPACFSTKRFDGGKAVVKPGSNGLELTVVVDGAKRTCYELGDAHPLTVKALGRIKEAEPGR